MTKTLTKKEKIGVGQRIGQGGGAAADDDDDEEKKEENDGQCHKLDKEEVMDLDKKKKNWSWTKNWTMMMKKKKEEDDGNAMNWTRRW